MKLTRQALLSLRHNQNFSRKVGMWLFGMALIVLIALLAVNIQLINTQHFLREIAALNSSSLAKAPSILTLKHHYLTTLHALYLGLIVVICGFLVAIGGLSYYWVKHLIASFTPYLSNWRGNRQAAMVFASQFGVLFTVAVIATTISVTAFFSVIVTAITNSLAHKFSPASLGQLQTALNEFIPGKVVFFSTSGLANTPSTNLSPAWLISWEVLVFWGALFVAVICVVFVTAYITINRQNRNHATGGKL